jgi:hypothetical protein
MTTQSDGAKDQGSGKDRRELEPEGARALPGGRRGSASGLPCPSNRSPPSGLTVPVARPNSRPTPHRVGVACQSGLRWLCPEVVRSRYKLAPPTEAQLEPWLHEARALTEQRILAGGSRAGWALHNRQWAQHLCGVPTELAVLGKEATDREPAHVVARTARAVARRVLRSSGRRRRVLDTLTVGRCKQGTSQ